MSHRFLHLVLILITSIFLFEQKHGLGQTFDTISNWDGKIQAWDIYAGSSSVVNNPDKSGINTSAHCLKVMSTGGMYDLMMYEMEEPANFDFFPRFNMKILAPPGGGDVVLKFQNEDNTEWEELLLTPVPGEWTNLVFDFSGKPYHNFIEMVIFLDFMGPASGQAWYIDDILRELPPIQPFESKLPIVVINTFGKTVPDEPKISARMGIIDNGAGNMNHYGDPFNHYDGWIGIERRGQSSQMFPKKSYAVETRDSLGENLDVALLGMPAENDWILYAPYTDKSMLRNPVTFDIARKFGGYHSRTRFCELILNNDYRGVFVLMEQIKKDDKRVDIATLNPDEITGDDVTGGYIIKVDKIDPGFNYQTDGWRSNPVPAYPNAMDITFQYYYPSATDIVTKQKEYIRNFITTAENTLTNKDFKDPNKGYQKYFDVPSFIDFMLVNEVSKEVDKYRYSTYFHKDKESKGGKLFAGPVWDFDLGYGNVDYWSPGIVYTGWVYLLVAPYDASIMFWWKRLMEDAYFKDLAKTRWIDIREDFLREDSLMVTIQSMISQIDSAKERNYHRWPILGEYVWPNYNWKNNTYEDEVTYFRNFLLNRINWIDNNLPGNELHPWVNISATGNRIKLRLYGDYFRRTILDVDDFTLNDAPLGMKINAVQYTEAAECILILSSDVSDYPNLSVEVDKKAINTYKDITSNKLSAAGIEPSLLSSKINAFHDGDHVRIRTTHPEKLPEEVEIIFITGQRIGSYQLNKTGENVISQHLEPGIYFLVFRDASSMKTVKFVVGPTH